MLRRRPVELHVNHERWLVSYADFVTLLFAFFVVMYSVSQVNESKYRVLSSTLTEIFSDPESSLEPIQVGDPIRSIETQAIDTSKGDGNSTGDVVSSSNTEEGVFRKIADLPQLSDQFTEQFSDLIDDKTIQVNSNEYWLQISLNNSILFPLGSVQPSRQAEVIFEEVSALLRDLDNPVQVEGFTDNAAINTTQFPSNWELSAARAAAVVKLLVNNGVSPQNLSAVGYGEFQPIAENETVEGRAQNRRVVLMIAREKIDRPRLKLSASNGANSQSQQIIDNTSNALSVNDLSTEKRTQSQVSPQPGLENKDSNQFVQQTIEERLERLVNDNPDKGLDIILSPADKVSDDTAQSSPSIVDENGEIKPVELDNGELLFSSDPNLPRNGR